MKGHAFFQINPPPTRCPFLRVYMPAAAGAIESERLMVDGRSVYDGTSVQTRSSGGGGGGTAHTCP